MNFKTLKVLFLMCLTAVSMTFFIKLSKNIVKAQSIISITSVQELMDLATSVNNGTDYSGETIVLKTDITLNDISNYSNWATSPPSNVWTPIGISTDKSFNGTFDGGGFSIIGLYAKDINNNGFLGNLGAGGIVCNLQLKSCFLSNSGQGGGIAANNSGTIYNCSFNGNIKGNFSGGISGRNKGNIINCHNYGSINGGNVGGIVGYNFGIIENSCNLGSISGTTKGGIVGTNMNKVQNCYWLAMGTLKDVGSGSGSTLKASFATVQAAISVKVNGITYSSLIEALNSGASYYSTEIMALKKWEITDGVLCFETVKEVSIDLEVLSDKLIQITINNSSSLVQYWIKENNPYGNNTRSIWALVKDFSTTNSIITDNTFNDYDTLYFLARFKDSENNITQIYKIFTADDSFCKIKDIEANGQNYSSAETIYLPLYNASLNMSFSIAPETVSASIGNYSNNVLTIESFEQTGSQTITVICDGVSQIVNAYVYDNSKDYVYFENVEVTNNGNSVKINPTIKTSGAGTEYSVLYYMNKIVNSSGIFVLKDSGYYYYKTEIISYGRVIDSYTGYYKYCFTENCINTALELYTNVKESINVGQIEGITGKIYQIIKWDCKGEYVVKTWTSTSYISFSSNESGIFLFQYRVKTAESECNFEQEAIIKVTVGSVIENTAVINLPNTVYDRQINKIEITNSNTTSNVMYKFIIRAKGFYSVAEYYSPDNVLEWIPNKKGDYTIEVRIISGGSYGYADTVIYQSVTVI